MKRNQSIIRSGKVLVCALLILVLSLTNLNDFVSAKANEGNTLGITENFDGTITTETVEEKSDGSVVTTSITTDEDGTVIDKKIITEKTSKKGNKTIITKRETIDGIEYECKEIEYKSGKKTKEESSTVDSGEKMYCYSEINPDRSGKTIVEMTDSDGTVWYSEDSHNKDGSSVAIGKAYDPEGNSKIMEVKTDADGNSVTITQIEHADGYKSYNKHISTDESETEYDETTWSEGDSRVYKIVDDKEGNTYVSDVEYSADGKEAVIPDRLWDRIDVNVIEKKAFKNNKNLSTIIINSDRITEVGKQAFKGISTDVTIKIKADKTDYKRIVKLIKKSGISKKVKFERIT